MTKLKLLWLKWKLRRELNKYLRMEEEYDVQSEKQLTTRIFPYLEGQRKKVIELMAQCKKYDLSKGRRVANG